MLASHSHNASKNVFLDVLRGWAILGVVTCHIAIFVTQADVYTSKDLNENFVYVLGLGRYGVELFFFISGYLLSSIYKNTDIPSQFQLRKFFAKRALRIYPLWIIFGIIGFAEWKIWKFGPWTEVSVSHFNPVTVIAMSVTFTLFISKQFWSLVPGGWSIQTEMFQYLLFPMLRHKKKRVSILTALITLYFICQFAVGKFTDFPFIENCVESLIRLNLIPSIFFFFVGILISESNIKKIDLESASNAILKNKFFVSVFMTSLTLGFFTNPLNRNIAEGLFMLFLYNLLAHLVVQNSLTRNIFKWLGQHSYFLYFCHFQVIFLLNKLPQTRARLPIYGNLYAESVVYILLIVSICAPLAALSLRFIEKPMLSLSRFLK